MPDGNDRSKKYLKIALICERYCLGRTKVHELIRSGCLRAVKVGATTLVDVEAADEYFSRLPALRRR